MFLFSSHSCGEHLTSILLESRLCFYCVNMAAVQYDRISSQVRLVRFETMQRWRRWLITSFLVSACHQSVNKRPLSFSVLSCSCVWLMRSMSLPCWQLTWDQFTVLRNSSDWLICSGAPSGLVFALSWEVIWRRGVCHTGKHNEGYFTDDRNIFQRRIN